MRTDFLGDIVLQVWFRGVIKYRTGQGRYIKSFDLSLSIHLTCPFTDSESVSSIGPAWYSGTGIHTQAQTQMQAQVQAQIF